MEPVVRVVVTDFGTVRLSDKTLSYLSALAPDWQEIMANKRRRGKRARFVREQVRAVEKAACVAASVEWVAGGELNEF